MLKLSGSPFRLSGDVTCEGLNSDEEMRTAVAGSTVQIGGDEQWAGPGFECTWRFNTRPILVTSPAQRWQVDTVVVSFIEHIEPIRVWSALAISKCTGSPGLRSSHAKMVQQ
jgi:hypothetical protein